MKTYSAAVDNARAVAVVGPTASGKSELAVRIAETLGGEVVSADSRQVYRGMDIGSNKITQGEMRGVPHHLLDVADPGEQFTVADYRLLARQAVNDILSRGKFPIVCGGTGFYIDALLYDTTIPAVPPQAEFRAKLERKSAETLYEQLKRLDPRRAATIEAKNKRRLIRALEIIRATGKPVPLHSEDGPQYKVVFVAPYRTREELKERIAARNTDMRLRNVIEETKKLLKKYPANLPSMSGIGYLEISRYLAGEIPFQEAVNRAVARTYQYSKRQMTWFKKDERIKWIDSLRDAIKYSKLFLKK